MATKPTESLPNWFPTDPGSIEEPDGARKLSGYAPEEVLPSKIWNWLFYSLSLWLEYLCQAFIYDAVIGTGVGATHATLELAIADSDVPTNAMVLIRNSITGAATATSLTKAGWRIYALPGVTFTKGVATTGISIAAARIEIHGLRFVGFTTGGNKAITLTSAGTYARIMNCNFAASTATEIDDASVPAGSLPTAIGNITE